MSYGSSRIYPIFGPTGTKIGKFPNFFSLIITLAATSFEKENYLNKEKTLF